MVVEPVSFLIKTKIDKPEQSLWIITLKVGQCIICPDIIVDCLQKTIEINWAEIEVAKLTKEQFCVLECLLDMENDIKNIILPFFCNENVRSYYK